MSIFLLSVKFFDSLIDLFFFAIFCFINEKPIIISSSPEIKLKKIVICSKSSNKPIFPFSIELFKRVCISSILLVNLKHLFIE